MRKTQTIIGTLALTTLFLGGFATPAAATPMPAATVGHVHCSSFVLAPHGTAVATPLTTEVVVSLTVTHDDTDSQCRAGTYSLTPTNCAGLGDSESADQTQAFPLVARIFREAWEDKIFVACTMAIGVPFGADGEGVVVVGYADIWIIEE